MLLLDLTLHDFRTYGGRQSINLAPKGKKKPIILIGGLNGAGKTTLLDALQLVLYGQRAQCASRGDLAYKTYLRQAIHRKADPTCGASIELSFSHASEGQEYVYNVRRTWTSTGAGIKEHVEVEVDGVLDQILTEQWDERVDDFAPHRISQLFFFDGEKIAELAEQESSAEVLKTAVHSLLGLELVDRLSKDLGILGQKKRRGGDYKFDRTKIDELEPNLERLKAEIKDTVEKRATLLNDLARAEKAQETIQDKYRGEGGELAEKRTSLEAQKDSLEANMKELRDRLRDVTLSSLPLAIVQDLLLKVDEQAHSEEEAEHHTLVASILEHRDKQLLKKLKGKGLDASSIKQFKGLLADDRKDREIHRSDPSFLDLDPEDVRHLDRLVKSELPAQVDQAKRICLDLDSAEEQALILERKLKSIPEEGTLSELREQRSAAITKSETLRARGEALEERLRVLKSQEEGLSNSYVRELEKQLAAAQSNKGLSRKLDRIAVASEVLEAFRGEVLASNLGRVEGAVLDSFRNLIRKPNLVSRLSIDSDTFAMDLTGGDENPLERDDLSAGEKQLLAIAILWGLARTSGLPLPVIIDTPLGRLDSKHRTHLVERYFPHASHQVLLLSTDEEIKESRLTDLEPFVSRSYLLEYEPSEDRTLIHEGYFAH